MICLDASAFFTDMVLKGHGQYELTVDAEHPVMLKVEKVDHEKRRVQITIGEVKC